MSQTNQTLIVLTESLTFYFKSKYIYLTAKTITPFIENNKIVLLDGQICQFKFIATSDNCNPALLLTKGRLEIEIKKEFEEVLIKGSRTVRFTATKLWDMRTISGKLIQNDYRLISPFRMLLSGSSGTGTYSF